jgi:hypothetical protein
VNHACYAQRYITQDQTRYLGKKKFGKGIIDPASSSTKVGSILASRLYRLRMMGGVSLGLLLLMGGLQSPRLRADPLTLRDTEFEKFGNDRREAICVVGKLYQDKHT